MTQPNQPQTSQEQGAVACENVLPLSKNWWITVRNERGSGKFEAFDFIKIELETSEFKYPITDVMVLRIDGIVSESHSIVSRIIHMNIDSLQQKVSELESKVLKLKRLILLVDDSVSKEQVNDLSIKQWAEYLKDFPEDL